MRILHRETQTMEMTVQELLERYWLLGQILNGRRQIATTGAFRLAKVFKALQVEALPLEEERNALIKELGEELPEDKGWKVKDEHAEAFQARWKAMADRVLEVDVRPVPVKLLGEAGGISAGEFVVLGELIAEEWPSNGKLARA